LFKKVLYVFSAFIFLAAFFTPCLMAQYIASDIIFPPGYEVTKIAETNKVYDPYRLTVDPAGNIIVAGYGYLLYKIDANGQVQVIGKTRKYDITPLEIEISPDGNYVLRSGTSGIGTLTLYKFVPPDAYIMLFADPGLNAIGYDKLGHFYAAVRGGLVPGSDPPRYYKLVNRYDSNFQFVETAFSYEYTIRDFCFDSQNNLYVLVPGSYGSYNGVIIKVSAGGDGIPGPLDPWTYFAGPVTAANDMTIDDAGNLYLDEYLRTDTDGFSAYDKWMLTKITPAGVVIRNHGPEFASSQGLACKGGFLYVSEFLSGVIAKVNLATFQKTDFTENFGIDAAGAIAFDANDNLYTESFRQNRLLKMNPYGRFDQVGAGTGYAQSITFDGTYFYLGSADLVGANGNQVLKIDPLTGVATVVATQLNGYRSVALDSYGRLILNTVINEAQNQFGADIIDLMTGAATPYLTGLHNKGRCIRFDARQNLYVVEGIGDGIKKVLLAKDYSSPRDISMEPLFYDFRTVPPNPPPPTIYFFAVNHLEEVFIPRMDSGDVFLAYPGGNVEFFARGFVLPTHAAIDRDGALYIADASNGIFKIVHKRWAIHTLTIQADSNGTTNPTPGIHTYVPGNQVQVTAVPNTNYEFVNWTGSISSTENPVTVTMDANKTIKANFRFIFAPIATGRKVLNRTFSQAEYIDILSWVADPANQALDIAKYRIYQIVNGTPSLLVELAGNESEYYHRRAGQTSIRYAIAAVTRSGREGAPAEITVQ